MELEITHDRENRIFRTVIDGQHCQLRYRDVGPTMIEIFETFVPLLERRQGIGTALVEAALRYAQLNNYMVVPTCIFTADYMNNHHEFAKMRVEAS